MLSSAPGITVEVCVDSVESAVAAAKGGANRLELCGNLALGGGTTPSIGLFQAVRSAVTDVTIMLAVAGSGTVPFPGRWIRAIVPIVMIRPRTGDFCYTPDEFAIMREDIRAFKHAGAHGIVMGVLTKDGRVDIGRSATLASEAAPLQVCFHRAFDMTRDPMEALNDVRSIEHVTRILTSGHRPTAPSSLPTLRALLEASAPDTPVKGGHSLGILPGSGINSSTVRPLLDALLPHGLRAIHLSGGSWIPGTMEFRREGMGMGIGGEGEWGVWRTSEERVRQVRHIADEAWEEYAEAVRNA
ncbi:uncharacterized protein FIBRA_00129 [Fibroporia radiculosa]|uniref:Copper homeostasis protein cutC homolog n=1 Tax=Fibroporia radiculosa TaxID=599839 RepID=J7RUY3_9APHY|nr:uncharacterized protein FIBRA_00129 [Fibroporia radiculosa]CCL98135.1 predicted protein [Fibroporia radiculosa]